ncbi:Transposase for transposon Tn3 [Candidatus Neptunochlamydia vexilliferae]|uniref:Transposase for transposon Tn3 n=1 Tax=Candidatus Neptunichlamydia vexilliferae TaxID=1651774 RepID=A0ABS0B199_9BACT|nr:Transposase for transposon Tn3 [Candidatus Neptunochlamydia vexilliferae]
MVLMRPIPVPGTTTLTRLISEIRERAEKRLWFRLSSLPSAEQKVQLETLLQLKEDKRTSYLDHYRKGPVTVSGPSFNEAIERFNSLKDFGIQGIDFSYVPPVRLKVLGRYASMASAYKISRMSDEKRIATLLAFTKAFETIALDEALDVLDLLITEIAGEAKKIGQKKRLRTLKDLDRSALSLAEVCHWVLDDNVPDESLRKMIFATVPREKMMESVKIVNDLARPPDDDFHDELVQQYGRVRRFLPHLLDHVEFKAAPGGKAILEAFDYLRNIGISRKRFLKDPPIGIIPAAWERLVMDQDEKVSKKGYTLCFLDRLQDALRRRDIYVENSDRWGDTRAKLLQGAEWQANRIQVYRSIGHPLNPKESTTRLASQLDEAYKEVMENFSKNENVRIDYSSKRPSLTITHLDKIEEPPSLKKLKEEVQALLPKVDLTELLLEVHAHTGFANEFTHVSESHAKAEDIAVSICAVLMAEACNIGLEPLVKHHIPALTRHRLSWVKQNYLRSETLTKSNARLVDYQSTLLLPKKWGGGEVASADGLRFVTPIRTINAGPNRKYFGSKKGITWYNFVSDQYSGFHGIVVPGTLRDSIFVLEGLLEQQTGLSPTEIMTDTAGTSDMIFGLFWLLGYQFSPRLADAGEAVFWRIDKNADYGPLDEIARSCVNTHRIEQHWDDMMRVAGSLKIGTVHASELIRSLLKSDKPSSLAQAIIDLGRINKTLYLLNYIDDEDYRRRILNQLNRGEGRHSMARAICHGQRGEIRKRYREGQEDQLGALGLVINAAVLWNTIYMEEALKHLRNGHMEIQEEDEARLSPLVHEHINVLGHYSFTLAESVLKGKLRPLNKMHEYVEKNF